MLLLMRLKNVTGAVPVTMATMIAAAAQVAGPTVLRDHDNSVTCVVTRPVLPGTAVHDADYLTVDVRLPGTPPAAVLARLPAAARSFSTLPVRVFLVPAPAQGVPTAPKLRRVDPLSVQPAFVRPVVNGTATPDQYVRVTYPRELLQAGIDVVAERSVTAPNGEQVSSQTRCRIAGADAAHWQ